MPKGSPPKKKPKFKLNIGDAVDIRPSLQIKIGNAVDIREKKKKRKGVAGDADRYLKGALSDWKKKR